MNCGDGVGGWLRRRGGEGVGGRGVSAGWLEGGVDGMPVAVGDGVLQLVRLVPFWVGALVRMSCCASGNTKIVRVMRCLGAN